MLYFLKMNLEYQNPNFICIGPEKTGTTWLYTILSQHPQFFLPPVKEIRYFWERVFLPEQNLIKRFTDSHWHYFLYQKYLQNRTRFYIRNTKKLLCLEKDILGRLIWDFKYLFFPHTESWYSSLFKSGLNKVTGDITPLYYRLPETEIHQISKSFPNLKIIILLRNPIDRSWSKARMNLCRHRNRKFEEVKKEEFYNFFDEEFNWLPSYIDLIDSWKKYFPSGNVHVNFYDKLVEEPLIFLTDICDFLKVDINKIPDFIRKKISQKVNQGLDISIPTEYLNYLIQLYSNCIEETSTYNKLYPKRWTDNLTNTVT